MESEPNPENQGDRSVVGIILWQPKTELGPWSDPKRQD